MKTKWKLFAINHFFSNQLNEEETVAFFDKLMTCTKHKEADVHIDSDSERIMTWSEYEYHTGIEMRDAVKALAHRAQEVEALP